MVLGLWMRVRVRGWDEGLGVKVNGFIVLELLECRVKVKVRGLE